MFMWLYGFQILHMHIASVEKLPLTTTGSPLQIRCKTFLSVTFVIPRERDCHEVFGTLQKLSQPGMARIVIIALIMYEVSGTFQQLAQPSVAHLIIASSYLWNIFWVSIFTHSPSYAFIWIFTFNVIRHILTSSRLLFLSACPFVFYESSIIHFF